MLLFCLIIIRNICLLLSLCNEVIYNLVSFQYKLCKVRRVEIGTKGVPYLVTGDARTIRYPDPLVKVNDTVVVDIKTGKMTDFIKFDTGNLAMVIGGRNMGRVGLVTHRERHQGEMCD